MKPQICLRGALLLSKGLPYAVCAAMLIAFPGCNKPDSENKADSANSAPIEPKEEEASVDETRYAVQQNSGGFTDRQAVVELIEAKRKVAQGEEGALKELRLKHEKEGRRIDFNRDYIVRISKNDKELPDHCEVIAENPEGLKSARFWVHRSVLQGADSLTGSGIITGYTIFRGASGTLLNDEVLVHNLTDLIAAIYDGSISEEDAAKCVFMPKAHFGRDDVYDTELMRGGYVIYRVGYYPAHGPNNPDLVFAIQGGPENLDPIRSGPVRFVKRQKFTTRSGRLFSLPVVALEKGIK